MKIDWNNVVRQDLDVQTVLVNGTVFRYGRSGFYLPNFTPADEPSFDGIRVPYSAIGMVTAYREAELYRMAVLDEDFPSSESEFFDRDYFIGVLGDIGYREACPEIRESMLHDLDGGIRGTAAEALGKMGDTSYVPDIIIVLQNDPGREVKLNAAEALGSLRDPIALGPLKEFFDEGRLRMHREYFIKAEEYDPFDWPEVMISLAAMMKIGGALAEQTLKEGLADPLLSVREGAKRGYQMGKW